MIVSLLSFFALLTTCSGSIKDCGNGQSRFQFTELALKPDPPVSGGPVDMTVVFTNPGEAVTDGTVTTSITLNFIPFSPSTEPLCTNTKCPLVSGLNDRSTSSTTPTSVQGKVVTKIVWTALDGSELLCITTTFSLGVLSKNDTKSLRGSSDSTESTSALNETFAAAIKSMFRRKRFVPKVMNSTALTVYTYKRRHATNGTCPLTRAYNPFLYMCFPHENLLVVSTVNYPLRNYATKKTNALRSSSF